MKAIIIEDEIVAANRLTRMLNSIDSSIQVVQTIDTVKDSVEFLSANNVDLIFMDIQLADGLCFEIFETLPVETPVIFTTAYDQYTLKAFKVHSIDYLLKPVHPDELKVSLNKFAKMSALPISVMRRIMDGMSPERTFKSRFLVKSGHGFISVESKMIAYFFSANKLTYLVTQSGKKYMINHTLEQLEGLLDPLHFHKANRNFIVSCQAVKKVEPYFNNRFVIEVEPKCNDQVVVNRTYAKSFKEWLDR